MKFVLEQVATMISARNNKNVIVPDYGNDIIINVYQGNILRFKNLKVLGTSVTK